MKHDDCPLCGERYDFLIRLANMLFREMDRASELKLSGVACELFELGDQFSDLARGR